MSQGIRLSRVHISMVKSIKEATVELGDSNYVFGPNNSGKSNLLYALDLALGNARFEEKDLFRTSSELDKDGVAVVDLMFVPSEGDRFDPSWINAIGMDMGIRNDGSQFFAFRTEFSYDEESGSYRKRRRSIRVWEDGAPASIDRTVSEKLLDRFRCFSLDAHRDLSEDIQSRQSIWSRNVSSIDVSDELRKEFNDKVTALNRKVVDGVPMLSDLNEALKEVPLRHGTLYIDPLPSEMSDVYRGLDVRVNEGETSLPMSSLGSGSRSVAVISAVKSLSERDDSRMSPCYTLLTVEEPETHLHPHLQSEVGRMLAKSGSQTVVTTHSPYLLSQCDVRDMIYCHHDGVSTDYRRCPMDLDHSDVELINRTLDRVRPVMLFARMVVLVEGETERRALPTYIRRYLGRSAESMEITVMPVEGRNYKPYLTILEQFSISWIVFSDGEGLTIRNLNNSFNQIGRPVSTDDPNVFIIPDELNYERYIVKCIPESVGMFLKGNDEKELVRKLRDGQRKGASEEDVYNDILKNQKIEYAEPLAEYICDNGLIGRIPLLQRFLDYLKETMANEPL